MSQLLAKLKEKMVGKIRAEAVIVDSEVVEDGVETLPITVDTIKELFPDVYEEIVNVGRSESDTEMQEVNEAAESADMEDPEEKAIVISARQKKITVQAMTQKLATRKEAKFQAFKIAAAKAEADPAKLRASDTVPVPSGGSVNGNGMQTRAESGALAAYNKLKKAKRGKRR